MEEAARHVGSSERGPDVKRKRRYRIPFRTKKLTKAAADNSVIIETMPETFEKNRTNASYYDDRGGRIMWTVKWIFTHAGSQYIENKVPDNVPIRSLLQKFIGMSPNNVVRRRRLNEYVKPGSDDFDHLRISFVEYPCPSNAKKIHVCPLDSSLRTCFTGQTIIEFPELYVDILPENQSNTGKPIGTMTTPTTDTTN